MHGASSWRPAGSTQPQGARACCSKNESMAAFSRSGEGAPRRSEASELSVGTCTAPGPGLAARGSMRGQGWMTFFRTVVLNDTQGVSRRAEGLHPAPCLETGVLCSASACAAGVRACGCRFCSQQPLSHKYPTRPQPRVLGRSRPAKMFVLLHQRFWLPQSALTI